MRVRRTYFWMIAVLCVCATSAQAQTVAADCDLTTVQAQSAASFEPAWQDAHPNAIYARFADDIATGRWEVVFDEFRSSVAQETRLPPDARARLLHQLDALAADLAAVADRDTRVGILDAARAFNRQRFRMDSFVPVDADDEVYTLFPGTPDEIEINASTPPDVRRALCWNVIAADKLVTRYGETDRDVAVAALDRIVGQWDRFNATSYSMYPWELWANSLGTRRTSLVPPRRQVVFLHPSVSFGVTGGALEDLQRQDLAALEVAGLLVYNAPRTWYGGASVLVTLPAQGGPGVGGLVHLSPTLRGGYVFRLADGGSGGSVVVSLDLYKALTGIPARLQTLRENVARIRDAEQAAER